MIECDFCGTRFDPIATRWRYTWCGGKADCCDSAPLRPTLGEEALDLPEVFRALADQIDA